MVVSIWKDIDFANLFEVHLAKPFVVVSCVLIIINPRLVSGIVEFSLEMSKQKNSERLMEVSDFVTRIIFGSILVMAFFTP